MSQEPFEVAAVLADEDRGAPVRSIKVEEREAHRVELRRPFVERAAAAVRARHLPARERVAVIPAQPAVEAFKKTKKDDLQFIGGAALENIAVNGMNPPVSVRIRNKSGFYLNSFIG